MRNCNDQQKTGRKRWCILTFYGTGCCRDYLRKAERFEINKDNRMWRKINGGENIAGGKVGKELNAKIGQGIKRKWQKRLMCDQNKNNNKIPQKQAWRRGAGLLCSLMLTGTCWQVTGLPREKMLVRTRVVRIFFFLFFGCITKWDQQQEKCLFPAHFFPIAFPRFRGISHETIWFTAHKAEKHRLFTFPIFPSLTSEQYINQLARKRFSFQWF